MINLYQSPGRLGNKLWTLANVLAFSMEHDVELIHSDMNELVRMELVRRANRRIRRVGAFATAWLRAARKLRIHASLSLRDGEYVNLDGSSELTAHLGERRSLHVGGFYLAAPASLAKHQQDVINELRFDEEIMKSAFRIKGESIRKDRHNVAIHMRRGDYRNFLGGMMYYTDDVYIQVADLVRASTTRQVRFHLFSDEEISSENFGNFEIVAHRGNVPELDIAIMASCDAIFGPNSTFSQWASFIGSVPILVLEPHLVQRLDDLEGIGGTDFSIFTPQRFGEKSSVRIAASRAMVPAIL